MSDQTGDDPGAASLLASQKTYYDLRAPDYADESKPADRRVRGYVPQELARALVDEFRPVGDVLELACGAGAFTCELVRHAESVTAVDASPRMLARNRELADPKVTYVHADLFAWAPDRQYDAVFFGFWLSHVPPSRFDEFWALVRACVRPGGRVGFVDEDDRAAGHDDARVIAGVPAARRTLSDGRQFDIVKIFWDPAALEQRVRELHWDVTIRRVEETFMYGVGRPATT
jgi:demethylmenaquinone methyltransferase/2-methoxy-6-polyprenyl-1,4-benzoquinol methylase